MNTKVAVTSHVEKEQKEALITLTRIYKTVQWPAVAEASQ